MRKEAEAGNTLRLSAEDVGVQNRLTMDNDNAMAGLNTSFQKTVWHLRINTSTIEAHKPHQNPQEKLWDFVLVFIAATFSFTWNARTTGDTPDIFEWIDFDLWDHVQYWDNPHKEDNPLPGRWLGVFHHVRSAMCYWVISKNCK
eukprot:5511254-Ditylum_brightwellii.AAC.1